MRISKWFSWATVRRAYRWTRRKPVRRVSGLVFFFLCVFLLLYSNFQFNQVRLEVDEVAKQTIVSEKTAIVIDEARTESLKQEAAARVEKVYQEDKTAVRQSQQDYKAILAEINSIRYGEGLEDEARLESLDSLLEGLANEKNLGYDISLREMSVYLIYSDDEERGNLFAAGEFTLNQALEKAITEETIGRVYADISENIDKLGFPAEGQEFIKLAAKSSLRPTMVFDEKATEAARNEAMQAVQPVQKTIKAGEVIVRQGNRVTEEQISTLTQLGMQRAQSDNQALTGIAVLIIITLGLVMMYIRRYNPRIYENNSQLFMIGIIFIMILLITKILMLIEITGRPDLNAMMVYLAPAAAASMLIGILLEQRLAYLISVILAGYIGLLGGGSQLNASIVSFAGGFVGVFLASSLNQTSDLARAAVGITMADLVAILALSMLDGSLNLDMLAAAASISLINGLLSTILMFGSLPLFEAVFSVTSTIKLMELANPNNELLKRLLLEAPGTYHHSLMVGNLAEATAGAIGANSLLVRAGAYYHDIGKLIRPEYYVENQRGAGNPHDRIAPALSALIITSHTREGAELAQQYRLPDSIIDFILEHHGTSVPFYFYNKAVQEEGEEYVDKDSFRYEGPKPHSKELALVMLADSVEAAVRSMNDPSLEAIKDRVHAIIETHLNDHQLEDCDLTFKDLNTIERSFLTVLEGIYHKRIEYPENLARELSLRREQYGYDDFKPAE